LGLKVNTIASLSSCGRDRRPVDGLNYSNLSRPWFLTKTLGFIAGEVNTRSVAGEGKNFTFLAHAAFSTFSASIVNLFSIKQRHSVLK